jgi:hypothetical protein
MITSLRRKIASYLSKSAVAIDIPLPKPEIILDPFETHVRDLIREKERLNVDGEYKRHMVYAELIKRFPNMRKRDIALAIEVAIQKYL